MSDFTLSYRGIEVPSDLFEIDLEQDDDLLVMFVKGVDAALGEQKPAHNVNVYDEECSSLNPGDLNTWFVHNGRAYFRDSDGGIQTSIHTPSQLAEDPELKFIGTTYIDPATFEDVKGLAD